MNASAEAPFFLRNATLLNLSSSFAIEPTQQGCQLLGQKSFEPLKKNKKRLNKPEQLEQLEQLAVQAAEEIFCRTPEQTCWGTDWSHFSGMPCPKKTTHRNYEVPSSWLQVEGNALGAAHSLVKPKVLLHLHQSPSNIDGT